MEIVIAIEKNAKGTNRKYSKQYIFILRYILSYICRYIYINIQPIYGIWIGSGITEQYTIKSSTYTKETRSQIESDFGYNVDRGNAYLIKLLDFYTKDN